jgi:predicted nucleic acid-binding protein
VNVLVDTSVWSLALRRKAEDLSAGENIIVAELSELVKEGRARIFGLIRQELLSGIRSAAQYEKLRSALRSFPDVVIDTSDYESAAKASNECRAKGLVVSIVDILTCEIALSRDWLIFTTDPDFGHYARVLPIKLHKPRRISK